MPGQARTASAIGQNDRAARLAVAGGSLAHERLGRRCTARFLRSRHRRFTAARAAASKSIAGRSIGDIDTVHKRGGRRARLTPQLGERWELRRALALRLREACAAQPTTFHRNTGSGTLTLPSTPV